MACAARNELMRNWAETTRDFASAVDGMRSRLNGDGGEFRKMMNLAEEARLKTENARLQLEIHRAEHGC
jgi:hypothetical protein